MADPCKIEACVQRAEYEERLRVQKVECEERLRLPEEDSATRSEERLRVHTEMITTRCEERLRVQKEEHEEAIATLMKEMEERLTRDVTRTCEERLRVQTEEHERALLVEQDVKYYGYYPLPLEDFPLEIIALIADFVHDFGDLGMMALTCRRLHNGVLLSRQWIVVKEIVAATAGDVAMQKRCFHNRQSCAYYLCEMGLFRSLRLMNLSRNEVTRQNCRLVACGACWHGRLDVLKYLHTTYALTVQDFSRLDDFRFHPIKVAAKHLPVLKYLHSVMGFVIPWDFPLDQVVHCLETLKFIHSDVDFIANRKFLGDPWVVRIAAHSTRGRDSCGGTSCGACGPCANERLVYLRDVYEITKHAAREGSYYENTPGAKERIREVFDL